MNGSPRYPYATTNGGRTNTFSTSSRPSTSDENLYSHWQQPYTPPHSPDLSSSPSSRHRIHLLQEENSRLRGQNHDLVRENDTLKDRLDNAKANLRQANQQVMLQQEDNSLLREQLASANNTQQEQDTQINNDRSTIKRLYERNAQRCLNSKDYNDAVEQFQLLIRLMEKEISLKTQQRDKEGQRQAEEAQWDYQFEYGKALVMAGQLDLAEREFNSVLTKRKDRLGKRSASTRDVQMRLCEVLIRLGKTRDAKQEYYRAAVKLESMNEQNESDCTWTLQNATSYAHMLLEEEEYKKAVIWLKDIWLHRHKAARYYVPALETDVIASALSLVMKMRFEDASDLLTDLQQHHSGNDHVRNPSEDQISALLAYVHLARGKFEAAEAGAAAVYARCGAASVFPSSASIDCLNFHHADTLIRARSKQDKKEKYRQAKEVWDEIYQLRNEILAANPDQLKKHIAAGLTLADEWEKSCQRRSTPVRPTSATKVRAMAGEMRKMVQ